MSYVLRIKCQINDLFSQFGKYIAPTYYHDRCERSLQMYVYVMHKREVLLSLSALLSSYILLLFIGLAGPNVYKISAIAATEIFSESGINASLANSLMSTGPFAVTTPSLSTYSQQLCLFLEFHLKNEEQSEAFRKQIGVALRLDGLGDGERSPNATLVSSESRPYPIYCGGRHCDPIRVLRLDYVGFKRYRVGISFVGLESVNQKYTIDDIVFSFRSINTSFTTLCIWFRFCFLVVAFAVTCWFTHSLHRFPVADWSLEQRWTVGLLVLLLVTDNPFYPLQFLLGSPLPRLMEAFFQCGLQCALLLFWLCFYHGIRQNNRSLYRFYAPKLALVVLIWSVAFYAMCWSVTSQLDDPVFDEMQHFRESNFLRFCNIFFYILLVVYFGYLTLLITSAFTELRSMPYFDIRLKLQTFLMIFALTIALLTILLSSSTASVSQIGFLQLLPFSYFTSSSAAFLSIFSMTNLYICVCAYYYRPSLNQQSNDNRVVRDNPTLSMINDSDEDVIYGSDTESPLNPPKLIDTKNDTEESD